MKHSIKLFGLAVSCALLAYAVATRAPGATADAHAAACPEGPDDEMVQVGIWCVDKFEAVICDAGRSGNTGCVSDDNGNNSDDRSLDPLIDRFGAMTNRNVRAFSRRGVFATRFVNQYQALTACAASGKVLIPDSVWLAAALGTTDPGVNDGRTNARCHTGGPPEALRRTGQGTGAPGASNACVSQWGAEDMIGNLWERTDMTASVKADPGTTPELSDDVVLNLADPGGDGVNTPAVGFRGGAQSSGTGAGVFALSLRSGGFHSAEFSGFRCAKLAAL